MSDLRPPRAWHKKLKRMGEVDTITWAGGKLQGVRCGAFNYYSRDEVVLLKPTGLQDKNGKEDVYQKDIISYSISQTQHYKGVVEWSEDDCGFVIKTFWGNLDPCYKPWHLRTHSYKGFCAEVHGFSKGNTLKIVILGNEFQNPDLLEETK